jgi:ribosomal protein S18 acetylase RimI-like enzyme
MAAQAKQPLTLDVLDLRHFQSPDFDALLGEEAQIWADKLHWDFRPSCDIVRRYLDLHALSGYALIEGRQPVGYSYYVHEDHKVLIGDLFISEPYRTLEAQHQLLRHVVETAQNTPGVRRIEGQLMMLESAKVGSLYPAAQLSIFERNFMLAQGISTLRREVFGGVPPGSIVFERWSEQQMEQAANLIGRAYRTHVDSEINDQYRSVSGARRFLHNIVQYPGCGAFYAPAAVMALDRKTRELCGISLTSLVRPDVGHITQICVAPEWRGLGIGSELLWRSIQAFREAGCAEVSLTVTAANTGAVRLYERVGFRTVRKFRAYVWENFRK